MYILLDTNVLLWAAGASGRFDRATTDLLEDPQNTVMFSAASIWEIAIKTGLGRPDFQIAPLSIIKAAKESGFIELSVTASIAAKAVDLPLHHKDPFDRLLIVQAMAGASEISHHGPHPDPLHGPRHPRWTPALMINRGDILWLGIASGVTGGLIGGGMLGVGMTLALGGAPIGILLICIGGPASALIGWLMARRLAKQLTHPN